MTISDYIPTLLIIAVTLGFLFIVLPSMEQDSSEQFNATYLAVENEARITLKYINMNAIDEQVYLDNLCDVVFNNSVYRSGDATLCKLKIHS